MVGFCTLRHALYAMRGCRQLGTDSTDITDITDQTAPTDKIMKTADALMQHAISKGIFPGAVLLVSAKDTIVFLSAYGVTNLNSKTRVTADTVFDLASLTKPLATTLAVMRLIQEDRLRLDQAIGSVLDWVRDTDKENITIRQLLRHTAGFTDYHPFYVELNRLPAAERSAALKRQLVQLPLQHPIGKKELYSDLGFIVLGHLVEQISGKRLDRYLEDIVYRPLGLSLRGSTILGFVDLTKPVHFKAVAATERCAWRGRVIEGAVHDDNAYALGGIAGHAGLFGNALGVQTLISAILSSYNGSTDETIFPPDLTQAFLQKKNPSIRPLGFDSPATEGASCGNYFSRNSVGHLGFTGTSFWSDLEKEITVILLTNRIHPTRTNDAIKSFRPNLHNAVMEEIL